MRGLFARLTDRGRKLAACPGGAFGQKPAQRQVICRSRTLSPRAAVHQTIGRRASPLSHVGSSSYNSEIGGRASAQDGCPVRKGSKPPLQWRLVWGSQGRRKNHSPPDRKCNCESDSALQPRQGRAFSVFFPSSPSGLPRAEANVESPGGQSDQACSTKCLPQLFDFR